MQVVYTGADAVDILTRAGLVRPRMEGGVEPTAPSSLETLNGTPVVRAVGGQVESSSVTPARQQVISAITGIAYKVCSDGTLDPNLAIMVEQTEYLPPSPLDPDDVQWAIDRGTDVLSRLSADQRTAVLRLVQDAVNRSRTEPLVLGSVDDLATLVRAAAAPSKDAAERAVREARSTAGLVGVARTLHRLMGAGGASATDSVLGSAAATLRLPGELAGALLTMDDGTWTLLHGLIEEVGERFDAAAVSPGKNTPGEERS